MTGFLSYYYQIFGWVLNFFYELVNNYALALVIFTVFFRMILLPSTISQQKGSAKQMRMQAKLAKIQEKYKDYHKPDRQQKIAEEQQALYQTEGYSSMTGGCLPLLIQLPIMYGIYGAVYKPLSYILGISAEVVEKLAASYTEITGAAVEIGGRISHGEMLILGRIDEIIANTEGLSAEIIEKLTSFDFTIFGVPLYGIPSTETLKNFGSATTEARLLLLIPILAALTSLMSSVLMQVRQNKNNANAAQMKSMMLMTMLMMPAMSLWITFKLPAAVGVYWIISNLVAFFQTLVLGYTHEPKKVLARLMVEETIKRRSKEENLKAVAKLNDEN